MYMYVVSRKFVHPSCYFGPYRCGSRCGCLLEDGMRRILKGCVSPSSRTCSSLCLHVTRPSTTMCLCPQPAWVGSPLHHGRPQMSLQVRQPLFMSLLHRGCPPLSLQPLFMSLLHQCHPTLYLLQVIHTLGKHNWFLEGIQCMWGARWPNG